MIKIRKCIGKCGKELELNTINFAYYNNTKRFVAKCRNCLNHREIRIIVENNIEYQICAGECKLKKELNGDNFELRSDTKKWRGTCLLCRAEYFKEYVKNNSEQLKQFYKEWYENIKDDPIYKAKIQEYRDTHKDELRETNRKYNKTRKAKDKIYRIRGNMSGAVTRHLKKFNKTKDGSILSHMPYLMSELKQHLEDQFEWWMSWKNYGGYNKNTWNESDPSTWKWNLDHIEPHSDFEYDSLDHPEFKKCWALSNLRPYSAKQNFLDGINRTRHKKA